DACKRNRNRHRRISDTQQLRSTRRHVPPLTSDGQNPAEKTKPRGHSSLAPGEPSTMKRNNPHVLVIDDEADLCELLSLRLRHEGFEATSCSSGNEALALLESEQIDAVLLDFRLEDEDGLDVLSKILLRSADLPVIMLTAHGTTEAAVEAMKRGAYGFLTKPFDDRELVLELRHAVDHGHLKREVAGLRRMLGGVSSHRLLGTSAS